MLSPQKLCNAPFVSKYSALLITYKTTSSIYVHFADFNDAFPHQCGGQILFIDSCLCIMFLNRSQICNQICYCLTSNNTWPLCDSSGETSPPPQTSSPFKKEYKHQSFQINILTYGGETCQRRVTVRANLMLSDQSLSDKYTKCGHSWCCQCQISRPLCRNLLAWTYCLIKPSIGPPNHLSALVDLPVYSQMYTAVIAYISQVQIHVYQGRFQV